MTFSQYLRQLIQYKVVIIADDSGSMATLTRWDELCRFISTVFSMTEMIENRMSVLGVQQLQQITDCFAAPPKGPTPIVPVLRHVLKQSYDESYRGRIIIICTDGEPTNEQSHGK